jgi:hypothetical protein
MRFKNNIFLVHCNLGRLLERAYEFIPALPLAGVYSYCHVLVTIRRGLDWMIVYIVLIHC